MSHLCLNIPQHEIHSTSAHTSVFIFLLNNSDNRQDRRTARGQPRTEGTYYTHRPPEGNSKYNNFQGNFDAAQNPRIGLLTN